MANTAKPPLWRVFFNGTVLALAIHLGMQLLLAMLTLHGILPERMLQMAQSIVCALASFTGCFYTAGRTGWGTLYSSLATAGLMTVVLLLLGLGIFHAVDWSGQGGILLLAILGGSVAAGLLSSRRTKHRKRKKGRA